MRGTIACIVGVLALCSFARGEFPEKVTIGDRTIECRTVEEIRKLGFECEEIPWKDNAARVYIEAMNAYRPEPKELSEPLRKALKNFDFRDIAEEMKEHVEENEKAFELLRQADAMPRYFFPMHKTVRLWDAVLAGLPKYGAMARSMGYRIAFEFSNGKHADAIDDGLLTLRLGRRVSTEPPLISGLVGIAAQDIATTRFHGMVSTGKMNDAELQYLAEHLAKGVQLPDWGHVLKGEKASGLAFVSDLEREGYDLYETTMETLGLPPIERDAWPQEFRPDVTRKNLNAFYDFCEASAKKPLHEALLPANRIDTFVKDHRDGWDKITLICAVGTDRVPVIYARGQVAFDALRLRVALERFKLANKAYPKALDELVPAYLDKLPTDPFSGKPYGYRLEEDGHFVFWSVNEDLKDDGGEGRISAPTPWGDPDWVFGSRPPKEEKPVEGPGPLGSKPPGQ